MSNSTLSVERRLIGTREACVCDTLFDEATILRVADLLKTLRYRRVETSRAGAEISGGSAEIPEHIAQSEALFARLKAFAEEAFAASGLTHQRLYVNSTVYGDMYYPHRDFGEEQDHLTVLYYANPAWSTDWGGETILYDDHGDARLVVTPRPGRVLAFRGAILHRGGVPTRICYEQRLTIAYKLRIPEGALQGKSLEARGGGEVPDPDIASPQSATDAVAAVAAATAANNHVLAARIAEHSIAAGFAHPSFFHARAVQAEQHGRDEEALGLYEQARAMAPRNIHLLNAIGLCLTRLSRYQEAIYVFEQAARIAPAHPTTHHWLGRALDLAGRPDLAERAYARAAQLDPRHADAIAHIALIAARKGDERLARNHADRALRIDPSNATALSALAVLNGRTETT
ncbi:MAG TPA: 2OG-Fe(II) oxygenase [Rhizomicrobium sp.]|jgi:Tfp pilus assembly protein PilF